MESLFTFFAGIFCLGLFIFEIVVPFVYPPQSPRTHRPASTSKSLDDSERSSQVAFVPKKFESSSVSSVSLVEAIVDSEYEQHASKLFNSNHKEKINTTTLIENNILEYTKERDVFIKEIHAAGSGTDPLPFEYLNFPLNPLVDQNFYPIGVQDSPLKYTAYISKNGLVYHKRCGCCNSINPVSVFQAIDQHLVPCRVCYNKSNCSGYPEWLYSVHSKYVDLCNKCLFYNIGFEINENNQLEFKIDLLDFARAGCIMINIEL